MGDWRWPIDRQSWLTNKSISILVVGTTEEFPLGLVQPDVSAEVILELKRQGMTSESIPQSGQKV